MGLTKMEQAFYEHLANERTERQGPLDAEIVPDCPGHWYVIQTLPAHEHIASGHLIGRRFGVYQPMVKRKVHVPARGLRAAHDRIVARSMFPAYLFLYLWDVERHIRRVMACPGVRHFLLSGDVPAVVPDSFINRMQMLETMEELDVVAAVHKRRRWRRTPKVRLDVGDIITTRCRSMWDGIDDLDDSERIGVLHRALGLAS